MVAKGTDDVAAGAIGISATGPARRQQDIGGQAPPAGEAPRRPSPGSLPESPPRLTPLRELQLVEDYRKGGVQAQDALAELIESYQRRIYSVCYRMVRNPDDATDLTQDVLVKLIEGLETYDGRAKLSTWVIRVALNCCLSHLRRQKLRSHQSLSQADITSVSHEAVGDLSSAANAGGGRSGAFAGGLELLPQQSVEQSLMRNTVLQALNSLDAETRAILVLRDMQDLDYQQLAETFEVPVGTVKSRLFRARAALRAAVESLGGI